MKLLITKDTFIKGKPIKAGEIVEAEGQGYNHLLASGRATKKIDVKTDLQEKPQTEISKPKKEKK